jgi:hypothetical protein
VEQMGLELDLFLSMNSESPGKIWHITPKVDWTMLPRHSTKQAVVSWKYRTVDGGQRHDYSGICHMSPPQKPCLWQVIDGALKPSNSISGFKSTGILKCALTNEAPIMTAH